MKRLTVLLMLVILSISTSSANAQLMAFWGFGGPDGVDYTTDVTTEYVIGTPTLDVLNGQVDINGKGGTAYTDVDGTYHDAGRAAAWNDVRVGGAPDAEWYLTINTTGWTNIAIRWDYKSETAPSYDLDYRLDPGFDLWSQLLNNYPITGDDAWHGSIVMNLPTAIENESYVQLRMYDLDRHEVLGNDNYVFDNLEITGTPIPEPATLLLLGLGAVMIRKKR